MKSKLVLVLLLVMSLALPCYAADLKKWNTGTVGTASGNITKWNSLVAVAGGPVYVGILGLDSGTGDPPYNVSVSIEQGHTVVVAFVIRSPTNLVVSDAQSNTYTKLCEYNDAGNWFLYIYSGYIATALSSQNITISYTGNPSISYGIFDVSGAASVGQPAAYIGYQTYTAGTGSYLSVDTLTDPTVNIGLLAGAETPTGYASGWEQLGSTLVYYFFKSSTPGGVQNPAIVFPLTSWVSCWAAIR